MLARLAMTLALTGGTCIDPAGVTIQNCVVLITPRRVTMSRAGATPPRADRTIDVRGLWVVPGFVDNHVHLGRSDEAPSIWTHAGVTEVVENGSSVSPEDLSRRYGDGPRVLACGPIITKRGGYPALVAKGAPALEVSGAKDAARRTAALIERSHPASIKVAIERGFLSDLSDEGWPVLDRDEVAAIVKEAHAHHLTVRAHVTQQEELDLALSTGVDVIAHTPVERLSDASLRRAAKAGVAIVSTVALWPEPMRRAAIENLVRYDAMGGPIAIGSDYPNWKTPGLPIAELRNLNGAGFTPKQLLTALTRHTVPQKALHDVVVLRSDPLASIDALTDVEMVIRDGEIVFQRLTARRRDGGGPEGAYATVPIDERAAHRHP